MLNDKCACISRWWVLDGIHRRKGSECERRVKVFDSPDEDLRKRYSVYEERIYGELVAVIGEVPQVEGKSTLKREYLTASLIRFTAGRSRKFSGSVR
ncbi:hypothetical protein EDD18DRAFT_1164530 [Armillaria luteobubalina]|uniref:Uncharacterized protein n=1 Tax=Armillaria luteobubalina TaxID=153913 RepID=A0AA39Q834_9AGAR|nr:hypothetical protein EDD18DRAFT_1164530 [Armillaria luteobubalina]